MTANVRRELQLVGRFVAGLALVGCTASALAGNDVLWSVPYPSASVYGTSYSTVYEGAFPNNTEVADDFEATGLVTSLEVPGRGCGQCGTPIVDGVFVRFYEWTDAGPGQMQYEQFVPANQGFTWGGAYPYTLHITLPEPFAASGWHFVSVQVAFGEGGGVWNFAQNNRMNPINMPVHFRDNLDGGVWEQDHFFSTPINADAAITLMGEAGASMPVVESVSRATVTASDRIIVNGSGFGAPGNGQLLINNIEAYATSWSSTEIIAYVPEGISPGPGSLAVDNLGTVGDPVPITIVPRDPVGRVKWVFEGTADYTSFPPAVASDGTIYVHDIDGLLYALSPDGGLLWIVDTLLGQQGSGDEGPVAVADDGTIYVGTNPLGPTVELVAFSPAGEHLWTYTVSDALTWQAGPTIGPDGRIYGAMNAAQLLGAAFDVFSLNPDGSEAWVNNADPFILEDAARGSDIAFGPVTEGGAIEQMMFTADRNGDGRNWGFRIDDGNQAFATPISGGNDVGQTQLVADPFSGNFYMMEFGGIGGVGWGLQAFHPDGERSWRFDPGIASGATHPALGPDGVIYFGWDLGNLSAVSPDGAESWSLFQNVIYRGPIVSPTAPVLLAIGIESYNQPSFIEARSTVDGSLLWKQQIADDTGGMVAIDSKPRFSPDGSTAYFSTLSLPITPDSVFRVFAIDMAAPAAAPTTNSEGSRYFSVTPTSTTEPIALRVSGDSDASCVELYIQADGTLGDNPAYLQDWGTVNAHGMYVHPGTTYLVQEQTPDEGLRPDVSAVTTWQWGDTDNNGTVNFADVQLIILGFQGVFEGTTVESLDLAPCEPNGVINMEDALQGIQAFQGGGFPCGGLCEQ